MTITQLAECLKMLGNEYRLRIVLLLHKRGELKVGEISGYVQLSQPVTSDCLIKLFNAGIVTRSKKRTSVYYSLKSSLFGEIASHANETD